MPVFWDGASRDMETCHIRYSWVAPVMASGDNVLHPRALVPIELGPLVRERRRAFGWSQDALARVIGVSRRTILRVEAGTHRPGADLVHALEEALNLARLVPGWHDGISIDAPSLGPRCRLARLANGFTLRHVASAAGIGCATLSRFERELGDTPLLLGPWEDVPRFVNEAYAEVLGFDGCGELMDYCMGPDPIAPLAAVLARRARRAAVAT